MLDMLASDGPLVKQYMDAMNSGNQTLANQIFSQIPSASQKIIQAVDLNKMTQAIQAVERFYKTDVQPVIEEKQTAWINEIERFEYIGTWNSGSSYTIYNMVTYTVNGITQLYIATATPPVGTVPTNTGYWRVLTMQGIQGISGEGLNYRYAWNQNTQYSVNTAVTYDGNLWQAIQESQGEVPSLNSEYWKLIVTLKATTYPIQNTQPSAQDVGGLWFNTAGNPTKYYFLLPLDNPANENDIRLGKQVYNETGTLLTGTWGGMYSVTIQLSYNTEVT